MWSSDAVQRRSLLGAALVLPVGVLTACGFQLRGSPRMAFASVGFRGFSANSALQAELRRQLASSVRVLEAPALPEVLIESLQDTRERSVVASTAAAQVRELQLRLKFHFRASTPSGRELIPRVELLLTRDLSYTETAALAKEQEEAVLFRDMQDDVVNQVLRRLASIRL